MFIGCVSMKWVKMPSKINQVGQITFLGCKSLMYVKLPEALNIIDDSAFDGCSSLKSIKVPAGATRIYIDAFCNCEALETVIIPDSVTFIGSTILEESNPNAVIYCSENSKARTYAINNSYLYDDLENAPYVDAVLSLKATDITADSADLTWDNVEDAEGYIISKYDSEKETWIEVTKITSVGYKVEGLSNNTEYLYGVNTYKTVNGEIVLGNFQAEVDFTTGQKSQVEDNDEVNSGNTENGGSTKTDGSTDDGGDTDSDGSMKDGGSTGADANTGYNGNKETAVGKMLKVGKYKYKITGKNTVAFAGISSTKTTKVTVAKTVTIGGKTFKVTSIANKALYKKTKVTSVTIGNNVKTIGASAFEGCKKLSKVTVGSSVTTIKKKAFKNCKKLATINVKSKKLKSVGKDAFKGIKSTAKIKVPKSKMTAYRKLFKGKGQGSKVRIKKI